jgi:hypothetical protein
VVELPGLRLGSAHVFARPTVAGGTLRVNLARRTTRYAALECSHACRAKVAPRLRLGHRTLRLPVQSLKLRAGHAAALVLHLDRARRLALAHAHRPELLLAVTVTSGGRQIRDTTALRLKPSGRVRSSRARA